MRAVVLLPTSNDAGRIADVLAALRSSAPGVDVLVVDHSSDGTAALATQVAEQHAGITVHVRSDRGGLGTAYRDGFDRAQAAGYDVVITMAPDLSHDPGVISTLLGRVAEGADTVIGSRYVRGGGTSGWPWWRRWWSRWGNAYTRTVLGLDTTDCTSGFRAYRTTALIAIEAGSTTADGYALQVDLVRRLHRSGMAVAEVPVVFRDRTRRAPSWSARSIVGSTLLVTRWGMRDRAEQVRAAIRER